MALLNHLDGAVRPPIGWRYQTISSSGAIKPPGWRYQTTATGGAIKLDGAIRLPHRMALLDHPHRMALS
jgi:hypothetical protein